MWYPQTEAVPIRESFQVVPVFVQSRGILHHVRVSLITALIRKRFPSSFRPTEYKYNVKNDS